MTSNSQKDKQKAQPAPKIRSTTPRKTEPRAQLVVKIGGGEVRFEAGLGAVERRFDGVMERRGKRYGLTAAGVQYCEDLLVRLRAGAKAR